MKNNFVLHSSNLPLYKGDGGGEGGLGVRGVGEGIGFLKFGNKGGMKYFF